VSKQKKKKNLIWAAREKRESSRASLNLSQKKKGPREFRQRREKEINCYCGPKLQEKKKKQRTPRNDDGKKGGTAREREEKKKEQRQPLKNEREGGEKGER